MSTTTVNGVERFRSKDTTRPFIEVPRHGCVTWTFDGSHWFGWHYWSLLPDQPEWIPIEEFSRRIKERKDRNRAYYASHPNELSLKIGQRRGRTCRDDSPRGYPPGAW